MNKKTITALSTLAAAAVIFLGSHFLPGGNELNGNVEKSTQSAIHTSESQGRAGSDRENQTSKEKGNPSSNAPASGSGQNQATESQKPELKADSKDGLLRSEFPSDLIKAEKEGIAPFGYINATVAKVTDGDTFRIKYNGREYKVRLLDIDTPESVKAGVAPQPYSDKASDLTKKTLTGKDVKLIFEKDTTDQYDRLLAHVILGDGTYYNALMVQNGYAISVFYKPNLLLKDYFTSLEDDARQNRRGFWSLPEKERPFIEDSKGRLVAAYKLKDKAA